MLKIRKIGETTVGPFPIWPPVRRFNWEDEQELRYWLRLDDEALDRRLMMLRSEDPEKHAETVVRHLATIYAQYYGYDDAPVHAGTDLATEARLVYLKLVFEREMVRHVFGFTPPDTSGFEHDQSAAADYLEHLSLNNPGVDHPFFDFVATEMNENSMREFLWLEVIRNEVVDDEVAMMVPGLQHAMKQVVASNLWDECGNGKIDDFHTTWLVRLLSYEDYWPKFTAYRLTRPWFSMCTSNSFNVFLTGSGRHYASYGTFLINESWVYAHFLKTIEGMNRLGMLDKDRRIYFEAHAKIDPHHASEMIAGIRNQRPPLRVRQIRDLAAGAHQAVCAGSVMYDRLLAYFRQKQA